MLFVLFCFVLLCFVLFLLIYSIYLKKKKKGPAKAFFESYWVVFREVPIRTLELYESEEV